MSYRGLDYKENNERKQSRFYSF